MYGIISQLSNFEAHEGSDLSILKHFLYGLTKQQKSTIYSIFSIMAVIWSDYTFSYESSLPDKLVKWGKNKDFSRE